MAASASRSSSAGVLPRRRNMAPTAPAVAVRKQRVVRGARRKDTLGAAEDEHLVEVGADRLDQAADEHPMTEAADPPRRARQLVRHDPSERIGPGRRVELVERRQTVEQIEDRGTRTLLGLGPAGGHASLPR